MPGVVRQHRWSRLISKVFDLKGSRPDLQVLDDVMPVVSLYDPTDVEHHFGRDEQLWSQYVSVAAGGAGTYSRVEINPSPGYITVVEGAIIKGTINADVAWCRLSGAAISGGAFIGPNMCDGRFEKAISNGCSFYTGNYGALISASIMGMACTTANQNVQVPIGAVLDMDELFVIGMQTAAQPLYVTLYGYDRKAEESELG